LDAADKGIKVLAVAVGAVWTYYSVRRKLELSISGTIFKKNGNFYLLISYQLKNVGQTKYTIRQKGTYVGVFAISEKGDEERVLALEIFKDHGWIEPGEQIHETRIAPISNPETFIALKLQLRVVSRGLEWNVSSIVSEDDFGIEKMMGELEGGKNDNSGSEN
jgi:hypothetical protein